MMNDIDKNFAVSVTKLVCYRTSAKVRKMRIGTLSAHYNMLPSYLAKMRRINREFFFFIYDPSWWGSHFQYILCQF